MSARRHIVSLDPHGNPVWLKDAKRVFADTLEALMDECGLTCDACGVADLRRVIAEMVDVHYQSCWDDLWLWVAAGDDKRERARILMRGLAVSGGWRMDAYPRSA